MGSLKNQNEILSKSSIMTLIATLPETTNISTQPAGQLLKWVGNKFKYAEQIVFYFPAEYNKFIEPFVGTGAILATFSPKKAIAGDILFPLIEIWRLLQNNPEKLIEYYRFNIERFNNNRQDTYKTIRQKYNTQPNGLDLLIISRDRKSTRLNSSH